MSRDSANRASNVFAMPGPLGSGTETRGAGPHHLAPKSHSDTGFREAQSGSSLNWESIVNQLPFGLIVLGAGQDLQHENEVCREMMGSSVREKGGIEAWLASLCPDVEHREKVISSWRDHIWRNQLTRTFTLKGSDQKIREIEFRSSLESNGVFTLVLQDVTDIRRAEETQRHNKLKFRAMFSKAGNGAVLVDRTGRVIDANPAFLKTIDLSLKEIRLSTLYGLLHPEDAKTIAKAEEAWRNNDEESDAESVSRDVWLRTRSKEKRTRLTYCPIGDSRKNPSMGIYLFETDTEKNQDQIAAKLRSVATKAQALLNAVPDLIFLINEDSTIADFAPPSQPWSELQPQDSWRGQAASDAWPILGELLTQSRDQLVSGGKTIHADLQRSGATPFDFAVTLAPCGDGQILAVIRNLTGLSKKQEQPSSAADTPEAPLVASIDKVQHRFRNQLQLVTSLFSLEPQGVAARDSFLKWQIRLRAVAQTLTEDSSSAVPVVPMLRAIADEVCSLTGHGPGKREISISGSDDLRIDSDCSTSFALMAGEIMRLILGQRQHGPGPELFLGLRKDAAGNLRLHVRPGENRKFIFTDEESEIEILEILSAQMRGQLEPHSSGSALEWELIIPTNRN